jgi:molybdopterin synthase sulfur carrier subunit
MALTVKFVGALRHASGTGKLALGCPEGTSVRALIVKVTGNAPELKRSLINQQLDPAYPNALILVNGKEISVLNGLDTKLKDGDEVVFVPVVHGG